jgi:hypothetical protein
MTYTSTQRPIVSRRGDGEIQVDAPGRTYSLIIGKPTSMPWQAGSFAAAGTEDAVTGSVDLLNEVDGRGCSAYASNVVINSIAFHPDGSVAIFDASYEEHCYGNVGGYSGERPAVTGQVTYYDVNEAYTFTSQAGNILGHGESKTYNDVDTVVSATYDGRNINATVVGQGDSWTIVMTPPRGLDFVTGFTYTTESSARNNVGALKVSRNGVACSQPTGHLKFSSLSIVGSTAKFSANFDIACQGSTDALTASALNAT